jgi:Neuraminidase (sialidase)
MRFEKISEGFVSKTAPDDPEQVASCPRCVQTSDGGLICTFFRQKTLGMNDYEMVITRSEDGGATWSAHRRIWPDLHGKYSTCGSVSRSADGELFIYGMMTKIDGPDESNWCEATQGLKQNDLFFSVSADSGKTWSDPSVIPMPIAGSAEAPGALCVLRNGRWIAPYSPYNTFDPDVTVQRNQVITVYSDDRGKSWKHSVMLRFDDVMSNGAEAWTIQLADGRLAGTSWHLNQRDGSDYPNAYAVSYDSGDTWKETRSTGIMGQSAASAALKNGKMLFIYNQRKAGEIGVWLAVADPAESGFGILMNEIVWKAQTKARNELNTGGHSEWTGFSFGEPSVTVLADGTLFIVLWCMQPAESGIKYIRIRMADDK